MNVLLLSIPFVQFCFKQFVENAREDLQRLRQLQCPFIVLAVGVDFCPPSLAFESAPEGSLHSILKDKREAIERTIVHHIALQVDMFCSLLTT